MGYSRREARTEKKQNKQLRQLKRDFTAAKKSIDSLKTQLAPLAAGLGPVQQAVGRIDGVDNRLKAIEAAAPQLIAGLQGLRTLATSQEYGIGQVIIGGTPVPGSFVVTPDIPDAAQQATVSQQFLAGGSGPLGLLVGVRSGENDGTGASLPAAHCRVTIVDADGGVTTSKPNAGFNGLPFYPIEQKSKMTSTEAANAGFPFGPKTAGEDADVLTNLTTGDNSANAPNPPNPETGADASAGESYTVSLTCVDASPSASEPNA